MCESPHAKQVGKGYITLPYMWEKGCELLLKAGLFQEDKSRHRMNHNISGGYIQDYYYYYFKILKNNMYMHNNTPSPSLPYYRS
jgi:hypothetical protein